MGEKEDLTMFVDGEKLMKGTLVKVVDVIKEAEYIYANYHKYGSMCNCFQLALISLGIWIERKQVNSYIAENITLFSFEIALEKFHADGNKDSLWWKITDVENRIEYFEWLLRQY